MSLTFLVCFIMKSCWCFVLQSNYQSNDSKSNQCTVGHLSMAVTVPLCNGWLNLNPFTWFLLIYFYWFFLNKYFLYSYSSFQPFIISNVGLCEEVDSMMLVMDQAQPSLKTYLLDSRALDHSPEYAATYNRYAIFF